MRLTIPAGVLLTLALLIPAAPAVAQTASPGLDQACETVERTVYQDILELVTIDLDTATDIQVRVLANQVLSAARIDSLTTVADKMQERLNGNENDLRAFLKTDLQEVWSTALRIAVNQTMTGAKAKVTAAGQAALDAETIDAYLAYLNDGLYDARAVDCVVPTAPPAPPPAAAAATTSRAAAPGLPVTGTNTGLIAAIGAALVLLGAASIVVARRRRPNTGA